MARMVKRATVWPSMTEPRFYVTSTEGFLTPRWGRTKASPGITWMVLDRLHCRRLMAQFRSEEQRGPNLTNAQRRAQAQSLAQATADRLNAA